MKTQQTKLAEEIMDQAFATLQKCVNSDKYTPAKVLALLHEKAIDEIVNKLIESSTAFKDPYMQQILLIDSNVKIPQTKYTNPLRDKQGGKSRTKKIPNGNIQLDVDKTIKDFKENIAKYIKRRFYGELTKYIFQRELLKEDLFTETMMNEIKKVITDENFIRLCEGLFACHGKSKVSFLENNKDYLGKIIGKNSYNELHEKECAKGNPWTDFIKEGQRENQINNLDF